MRCAEAVLYRKVCIIKTDIWYRGVLSAVSYAIADACVKKGLQLRAHWVWQRLPSFSPYAPAFSNVFIFADQFRRPHYSGLITIKQSGQEGKRLKPTQTLLFGTLIDLLTEERDVVIDPFAGTGSVMEAAASLHRRSVGIELSRAQIRLAADRLRNIRGFVLAKNAGR